MPMKNPPHPGRSIKIDCLEPLGLTVTEGAKVLRVARSTLSRVINGQASITPEMAIRLSKAFGSTPETWLKMQQAYDLAQMRAKEADITLERYQPQGMEKAHV
jgi:antitoxin HigA-1